MNARPWAPTFLKKSKSVGIVSLLTFFTSLLWAESKHRICFLSMNNEQEFKAFQARYQNVPDLEIVEFMPISGRDPLISLKEGIEKLRADDPNHPLCDGLVLSGHHNGEWWGARTSAPLQLSDLEAMKCDPEFQSFFGGVQALWMQGCNTMDESSGALLTAPQATTSQPSMQHRASSNYHVTPRYASLFNSADLYAWQGIAPGVKSGSPDSMILFMEGFTTTRQDALIANLKTDRPLDGNSLSDLSNILPNLFECRDPNGAWEKPQDSLFFTSDDRRRPRAQLSRDARTPAVSTPLCPIQQGHPSTTSIQKTLQQLTATPETIEANVRALTERVRSAPNDEKQVWQNEIKKRKDLLNYLQQKTGGPGSTSADTLEYATLLETLTGMQMPRETQAQVDTFLDSTLKITAGSRGEEKLLDTLRVVSIAAKNELMTEDRWKAFSSLLAAEKSSDPALREIVRRGQQIIQEHQSPSQPGGILTSPVRSPYVHVPPAKPRTQTGETTPVTPLPKVSPSVENAALSRSIQSQQGPELPKPKPSPVPPPKKTSTPTPSIPVTALKQNTPSCIARPNYKFGGVERIPPQARCGTDLRLDARCASDPWCWVPKCEQAGCVVERLCQSPSRPNLAQDSCMQTWQRNYSSQGRDLLHDPKACTGIVNCSISHTCVSKDWHQANILPNLKYGNWFCTTLEKQDQCLKYAGCIWSPK